MQINRETGVIFDALYYTISYFNLENIRLLNKPFAKNEDDIFEHYYEFVKKYAVVPPENLYLFFYFGGQNPSVMTTFLDENFNDLNYEPQRLFKLLEDKEKFKKFVYYYYLELYRKELNIEAVIKGDAKNIAMAISLLCSIHTKHTDLVYKLFYNFDELAEELTPYLKLAFHKTRIYRNSMKKGTVETAVNEFLNSDHVNELYKSFYSNKTLSLTNQKFAVSFFARFAIKAPLKMNNQSTLLIGDKCSSTSSIYANYKHITEESVSAIFAVEINYDIIKALKKGEKNITQLSFIVNYSRPHISKHIGILKDELAVRVSRKDGRDLYYVINNEYFKAAEVVMNKVFSSIYSE